MQSPMQPSTSSKSLPGSDPRSGRALICLLLFLGLQMFVLSPVMHRIIHADADAVDHHCAITLLASGQLHAPAPGTALVVFALTLLYFLPRLQAAISSPLDFRLSPSRAPPASD